MEDGNREVGELSYFFCLPSDSFFELLCSLSETFGGQEKGDHRFDSRAPHRFAEATAI